MEQLFNIEEFLKQQFETLQTANEYIIKLESGIIESIRVLRSNEEGQAVETIPYIIDGVEWLNDAMKLTVGIHNQEVNYDEIREKLVEIVDAVNNEDYTLVGDLLEYEILPVIGQWKKIIRNSIIN